MIRTVPTLAALAALLLAGCAHSDKPAKDSAPAGGEMRLKPDHPVTDAATQPFEDIGLKRDKIPAVLAAIKSPYLLPPKVDCISIAAEIAPLDALLGEDVDVPLAKKSTAQKGADAAGDALVNAIESTTTSVIPFRGAVREVTGAASRDRRMAAALQAGRLKRAFLKGIGQHLGCLPPAAPLPYAEDAP